MPSKRMNRHFTYSPELKLQAVKLYLEGYSCQSICEQLKIQDPKRIYVWNKAYQEKGELAFIDGRGGVSSCSKSHVKKINRTKKGVLTKQQQFEFIHNHASGFSI